MFKKEYLKKVILQQKIHKSSFLKFATSTQKKDLSLNASLLKGRKMVHVNATKEGGGVVEILKSLIPYLRALEIQCDWYYVSEEAGKKFFEATDKIRNIFQGSTENINDREWATYEKLSKEIAQELDKIDCDVLIINDFQLLLAGSYCKNHKNKVFFNHLDTSAMHEKSWHRFFDFFNSYYKIVFSNKYFLHKRFQRGKVKIFTPAIDPLSQKQEIISQKQARLYLNQYGHIPEKGPLVVQVSRFDVWKNPIGLIHAFRLIQDTFKNAVLVLVGFNEAKDNPLSKKVYEDVRGLADKSPEIFTFFSTKGKDVVKFTVMAQNAADIVVQNSIKEGFGLTATEAMWKNKPVIGGPAFGIREQIQDGKIVFIARNSDEFSQKIVFLLSHKKKNYFLRKLV